MIHSGTEACGLTGNVIGTTAVRVQTPFGLSCLSGLSQTAIKCKRVSSLQLVPVSRTQSIADASWART